MHQNDSAYVLYKFGKHFFRVPKNYILEGTDKAGINEPGFFTMELLLPDLAPRSSENDQKFQVPGFGDKIRISVHYKMTLAPISETVNRLLNSHGQRSNDFNQFGDIKYYHMVSTPLKMDLFTSNRDGQDHYVQCDVDDEIVLYKSCNVLEQFSNDIALSYFFGKQHIARWENIDLTIRNLIRSFIVKKD